jgi:alkylation response protein AidB-like acyl-CoA dehydrogenase
MDFDLDPELLALAEEARELGRKVAADADFLEDSWIARHSQEFAQELASRGWVGMTWPEEHGGGGRPAIERFMVFEALISEGAPLAATWFADRQMGPTLLQFGTDEQRRRFLPDMVAGRSMWAIGMSEPDAGSDVASLRTKAVLDGDHWVVDGQKVWTSGAALADWCYLVVRTDPDAPKHAGLSELIVDLRSPGIDVRPLRDMTDDHHFCEIHLDGVRVPVDNLVGELNGSFRQLMRQMEHERGGIDRLVANKRLYLDCLPHADLEHPVVRQQVAEIETGYRIGRLLVLRETLGQAPKAFSAATKTFCTEFEQRVADFCATALGPLATLDEPGLPHRVARNLCYAPGYTIMGGTTQILRNILGERVLGLPREPTTA